MALHFSGEVTQAVRLGGTRMNRIAAGAILFALGVGVVASISAAEPLPTIGNETRKSTKDKSAATFGDLPNKVPVILGPMEPDAMAQALKLEQEAYQRRLDVCLKLRQVALKLNDESLATRADDLERDATAVYHLRTAKLGVKSALRGSLESLDRKLGTGIAETPLTVAPPEPASATATAEANSFRVVKP
jgi:hypothetical protein